MDNEHELVYFKMQLLQAEIEMNAMIAENQHRIICDNQISYGEKEFIALIEKHGIYHNAFPFYRG